VHERLLDAEGERVQIALGDAEPDLAGEPGVELILGDRLEPRAPSLADGCSGSSAMLTMLVAIETLWTRSHGILK
jgi:hypothetical protein